jgi:hypothetical protein
MRLRDSRHRPAASCELFSLQSAGSLRYAAGMHMRSRQQLDYFSKAAAGGSDHTRVMPVSVLAAWGRSAATADPAESIRSSDRTMLAPAALSRMRPRSQASDGSCQCLWAVSARLRVDAWAGGRMTPVERGRAPPCSALQAESQLTQPLT